LVWDFVEEMMTSKGFYQKLRDWIMSSVRGGRVCININGQNGPYFKTHRGLRQGDPLSPLLFNLAVDALDHILEKAKKLWLDQRIGATFGLRGHYSPAIRG